MLVLKELNNSLPYLRELGSEVYNFIPEPRNFRNHHITSRGKKAWLKATLKGIKN